MGHLKIYCDSCGSDWNVYSRDNWNDKRSRTCPVCGKSINPNTWNDRITPAFYEMESVSVALLADTMEHAPLFTVSYSSDLIFPNRDSGRNREIMEREENTK